MARAGINRQLGFHKYLSWIVCYINGGIHGNGFCGLSLTVGLCRADSETRFLGSLYRTENDQYYISFISEYSLSSLLRQFLRFFASWSFNPGILLRCHVMLPIYLCALSSLLFRQRGGGRRGQIYSGSPPSPGKMPTTPQPDTYFIQTLYNLLPSLRRLKLCSEYAQLIFSGKRINRVIDYLPIQSWDGHYRGMVVLRVTDSEWFVFGGN